MYNPNFLEIISGQKVYHTIRVPANSKYTLIEDVPMDIIVSSEGIYEDPSSKFFIRILQFPSVLKDFHHTSLIDTIKIVESFNVTINVINHVNLLELSAFKTHTEQVNCHIPADLLSIIYEY